MQTGMEQRKVFFQFPSRARTIFSSEDFQFGSPGCLDIDSNNHLWVMGSADKSAVLNMLSFSGF
jgi:hypothetical protein